MKHKQIRLEIVCAFLCLKTPGCLSQVTECPPDPSCQENRKCEFSSIGAFNAIRDTLFEFAGCPDACKTTCTCTCNTSGPIYEALITTSPKYCHENPICRNPMIVKAMNYNANQFTCDQTFAIALKSVYQLCGMTNGVCRSGKCTQAECITTVDPTCRQESGIDSDASYIIGAYAMAISLLYLSAQASLTTTALGSSSEVDDKEPQTSEKTTDADFGSWLGAFM